MKKIILLSILSVFLLRGFTQSLELYYEDTLLDEGETLTITAHADSGMMSIEELDVLNISNNPLNIKCAREVISEVINTENSFCWGVCYSTSTDTSTVSIIIDPGEDTPEFIGDYYPAGNSGITSIKYIFYDMANPEDHKTFIVNYKATTESGIHEEAKAVYFSPAYPNPANKEVSIDYELENNRENVRFVIYNILGKTVKEVRISEFSGSLTLNTSDLNEGIYFYSLLINNEPTRTQKLIIKH